jgi:transposase
MMAEQRRIARTRGKSDPIDAAAVARAALRELDLPIATHDEASRELKLLVDRRDALVKHRTATINRLLWRVHELDPAWAPKAKSIDRPKHHKILAAHLEGVPASWPSWLAKSWPTSLTSRCGSTHWRSG